MVPNNKGAQSSHAKILKESLAKLQSQASKLPKHQKEQLSQIITSLHDGGDKQSISRDVVDRILAIILEIQKREGKGSVNFACCVAGSAHTMITHCLLAQDDRQGSNVRSIIRILANTLALPLPSHAASASAPSVVSEEIRLKCLQSLTPLITHYRVEGDDLFGVWDIGIACCGGGEGMIVNASMAIFRQLISMIFDDSNNNNSNSNNSNSNSNAQGDQAAIFEAVCRLLPRPLCEESTGQQPLAFTGTLYTANALELIEAILAATAHKQGDAEKHTGIVHQLLLPTLINLVDVDCGYGGGGVEVQAAAWALINLILAEYCARGDGGECVQAQAAIIKAYHRNISGAAKSIEPMIATLHAFSRQPTTHFIRSKQENYTSTFLEIIRVICTQFKSLSPGTVVEGDGGASKPSPCPSKKKTTANGNNALGWEHCAENCPCVAGWMGALFACLSSFTSTLKKSLYDDDGKGGGGGGALIGGTHVNIPGELVGLLVDDVLVGALLPVVGGDGHFDLCARWESEIISAMEDVLLIAAKRRTGDGGRGLNNALHATLALALPVPILPAEGASPPQKCFAVNRVSLGISLALLKIPLVIGEWLGVGGWGVVVRLMVVCDEFTIYAPIYHHLQPERINGNKRAQKRAQELHGPRHANFIKEAVGKMTNLSMMVIEYSQSLSDGAFADLVQALCLASLDVSVECGAFPLHKLKQLALLNVPRMLLGGGGDAAVWETVIKHLCLVMEDGSGGAERDGLAIETLFMLFTSALSTISAPTDRDGAHGNAAAYSGCVQCRLLRSLHAPLQSMLHHGGKQNASLQKAFLDCLHRFVEADLVVCEDGYAIVCKLLCAFVFGEEDGDGAEGSAIKVQMAAPVSKQLHTLYKSLVHNHTQPATTARHGAINTRLLSPGNTRIIVRLLQRTMQQSVDGDDVNVVDLRMRLGCVGMLVDIADLMVVAMVSASSVAKEGADRQNASCDESGSWCFAEWLYIISALLKTAQDCNKINDNDDHHHRNDHWADVQNSAIKSVHTCIANLPQTTRLLGNVHDRGMVVQEGLLRVVEGNVVLMRSFHDRYEQTTHKANHSFDPNAGNAMFLKDTKERMLVDTCTLAWTTLISSIERVFGCLLQINTANNANMVNKENKSTDKSAEGVWLLFVACVFEWVRDCSSVGDGGERANDSHLIKLLACTVIKKACAIAAAHNGSLSTASNRMLDALLSEIHALGELWRRKDKVLGWSEPALLAIVDCVCEIIDLHGGGAALTTSGTLGGDSLSTQQWMCTQFKFLFTDIQSLDLKLFSNCESVNSEHDEKSSASCLTRTQERIINHVAKCPLANVKVWALSLGIGGLPEPLTAASDDHTEPVAIKYRSAMIAHSLQCLFGDKNNLQSAQLNIDTKVGLLEAIGRVIIEGRWGQLEDVVWCEAMRAFVETSAALVTMEANSTGDNNTVGGEGPSSRVVCKASTLLSCIVRIITATWHHTRTHRAPRSHSVERMTRVHEADCKFVRMVVDMIVPLMSVFDCDCDDCDCILNDFIDAIIANSRLWHHSSHNTNGTVWSVTAQIFVQPTPAPLFAQLNTKILFSLCVHSPKHLRSLAIKKTFCFICTVLDGFADDCFVFGGKGMVPLKDCRVLEVIELLKELQKKEIKKNGLFIDARLHARLIAVLKKSTQNFDDCGGTIGRELSSTILDCIKAINRLD